VRALDGLPAYAIAIRSSVGSDRLPTSHCLRAAAMCKVPPSNKQVLAFQWREIPDCA
jgi:hypothetical protein